MLQVPGPPPRVNFSFDTTNNLITDIHHPGFTVTGSASSFVQNSATDVQLNGVHFDSTTQFNLSPLTGATAATGNTITFDNCTIGDATGGTANFDWTVNNQVINISTDATGITSNLYGHPDVYFDPQTLQLRRYGIGGRRALSPVRRARGNADWSKVPPNEILALQLLRKMVPQDVFRKYLKYGFVTVQGPSGLTYQIQRKSHIIKVWDQGKTLCTLCVYLKDKTIPPTDEVVAKMIIAECDEPDIWKRANVSWYIREARTEHPKVLSLGDISKHRSTANPAPVQIAPDPRFVVAA
jgi:hypothetical protein